MVEGRKSAHQTDLLFIHIANNEASTCMFWSLVGSLAAAFTARELQLPPVWFEKTSQLGNTVPSLARPPSHDGCFPIPASSSPVLLPSSSIWFIFLEI
jgi:hypothetical protein